MKFQKKILCIGAGYVGGPSMAMIAYKCPDCKVTVVDINPERIDAWNSNELPVYEPGFDKILKKLVAKIYFFLKILKNKSKKTTLFLSVSIRLRKHSAPAQAWPLQISCQRFSGPARVIH